MTRIGVDAYLGHERAMRYHKNGVNVQKKEHKTYHMHHQIEIKTVRKKTGFSKFN